MYQLPELSSVTFMVFFGWREGERRPDTVPGPGEGPGGLAPPLFLDQTEARRVEKCFSETGSLFLI